LILKYAFLFLLAVCFLATDARAHDPSKSYLRLTLETNGFKGQWDVPLKDLQTVVQFTTNNDGVVTWDDLNAHYPNATAYIFAHLKVWINSSVATGRVLNKEPVIEDFSDGTYLRVPFVIENISTPKTAELDYELFFDVNSLHRGLMQLDCGGSVQTTVFSPDHRRQSFTIGVTSPAKQFIVFLREGIFHIWTGYDHILFLIALLLPAVLHREANAWRGVLGLRPAFINVLKIVTAFTVAHSLTLSLAALQVIRLPSRLTESAIAFSVVLAAANNLWPVVRERGWMVAFFFGLVHGFGFANALADLGLVHGALALTLVGFNLGVEIGQLAIVAVFLPLAFALRNTWFYQKPLLYAGSALIILIAGMWLAKHVFDFKTLPF
jgi:HupE / UreJ protein